MVDLGITFPGETIRASMSFCRTCASSSPNSSTLVGLVLTHAHEDHIGAVLDLWPSLDCPIYATPFTAGMLKIKARRVRRQRDICRST